MPLVSGILHSRASQMGSLGSLMSLFGVLREPRIDKQLAILEKMYLYICLHVSSKKCIVLKREIDNTDPGCNVGILEHFESKHFDNFLVFMAL